MVAANLLGVIWGSRAARRRDDGGGDILNLASMSAHGPVPGLAVYGATKHAVLAFSTSLQGDLDNAERPIRVHALCPDAANTGMVDENKTSADCLDPVLVEAARDRRGRRRRHGDARHEDDRALVAAQPVAAGARRRPVPAIGPAGDPADRPQRRARAQTGRVVNAVKRVGHKGADLIEPGNTIASFDAALTHGVDMIELDVLPRRKRRTATSCCWRTTTRTSPSARR